MAKKGDKLIITLQSGGAGRFVKKPRRTERTVATVYADGRVRDTSGDVWFVKPTSEGLVTVG